MDEYAGRVLADRYRLPLPPSDEYEFAHTRAFDTYSGQEVLIRQVPLPEVVEAEILDADGLPEGFTGRRAGSPGGAAATRAPADPAVRRAIEAAQAAAQIPDHPRLDQVFDVFAEDGSLWIVSEDVPARPLAALLAERPLSPYRAAEVAADVLTALRALHAHGWVHRNITSRTVLVCDDGRILLTGLAAGAAEEALCGYDPTPDTAADAPLPPVPGGQPPPPPGTAATHPAIEQGGPPRQQGPDGAPALPAAPGPTGPAGAQPAENDARAARAGAIAAYRAGAKAAAARNAQRGRPAPGAPPAPGQPQPTSAAEAPRPPGVHGQINDPYGVAASPAPGPDGPQHPDGWHGALPRSGAPALPGPATDDPGAPQPAAPAPRPVPAVRPLGAGLAPAPPAPSEPAAPGQQPAPHAPAGHAPVPPQAQPQEQGQDTPPGWGDTAGWGEEAPSGPRRGPATALAAQRARQARMALVGPVTERWAPEQAGPVHENWQLAPPIGPATDLWALGALLFRAVQGHAPYPEESTAELVEMVCSEPPAFAEECGPLRPVVESLLRQDPEERPDIEELRGWLRSLIRSAPEPDVGTHVVAAPPLDTEHLPVIRRRGELVRRRRAGLPDRHGRHKRGSEPKPRRLGRTLLVAIVVVLAAAVAYAMVFMPKNDNSGQEAPDRAGTPAGDQSPTPGHSSGTGPGSDSSPDGQGGDSPSGSPGSEQPRSSDTGLPDGFQLRKDSEGFRIAVADGWQRQPKNSRGQVVYSQGAYELIVVPGRDTTQQYGSDPLGYQEKERELQPFRDSTWAVSSGIRRIQVGQRVMAEGQYTWSSDAGDLYVRNMALLVDGHYHVVQVRGPESERDKITSLYDQASASYQYTG
ncbi:protein kinase [Streptomyces sp. NPDC050560]|uniref:protein kinase n=1 Tax=Streptomyces sp. NPDC050560 TaxID=3365630 RepID=UPI0037BC892D